MKIAKKLPSKLQNSLRTTYFQVSKPSVQLKTWEYQKYPTDSTPMVSVIIPNFNHAEYLRIAIESAIAQTYSNVEIIVIDDGSTDDSKEIIASFKKSRFVKAIYGEHLGLPATLNRGFAKASGVFLTWLSADNFFSEGAIELLANALRDNSTSGMVYSDYSLVDSQGQLLTNSSFRKYDQDEQDSHIIRTNRKLKLSESIPDNFIGPFFLYRSEVAKKIGGYRDLVGFEDYDYWLRIEENSKITHISSSGEEYFYRIHAESLTAQAPAYNTRKRLYDYLIDRERTETREYR